jgi:hypothetical protein
LNRQALAWCRDIANQKPKRVLGMFPEAAYLIEKPYLQPLPNALPPVYEAFERVVDLYGYVSVDTNRYSIPERFVGQSVTVDKYPADIRICRRGTEIARHPGSSTSATLATPCPSIIPPRPPPSSNVLTAAVSALCAVCSS